MPSVDLFTSVVNQYLPQPHASLLNGILFGVELKATKDFYMNLRSAGLLHIVVLSGMNITILSAVVAGLTASFGKRLSLMLTLLTIIIFVCFVGVKAPIVRASFMGILTVVAIAFGKRNIPLLALLFSGLFVAFWKPVWITTVSFQLSYAATLGIILCGSVQKNKNDAIGERIKYVIWRELKPSLAAQLFTTPLILAYFKEISLIAPLSNLLVSPLLAPLMIFGFIMTVLGSMHPLLGLIPSYVCYLILSYIIFIVESSAKISFSHMRFY